MRDRRCSSRRVLFIVYYEEVGWKIMKRDTLGAHDSSRWRTVPKVLIHMLRNHISSRLA